MKKFLSPNEKIAHLRKKYKMKQDELAFNDKFAKITLSFVEMGRRGVTEKFMRSVCENFNEYFAKNNIDDHADFDEMIKSKEEQAKEFLDNLIEKKSVNDINIDNIEEAFFEIASSEYKSYSLKIGKIFYDSENMKMAKLFGERGLLGIFLKKDNEILKELVLLNMNSNHYLENFQDTVYIFEKYKKEIERKHDQIYYRIYYNYANALFRIRKISESFEIAKSLFQNSRVKDTETLFHIKNLFAVINYLEFKNWKKSVKIYEELLGVTENEKNKYYIYANLLDIGIRNKKIVNIENIVLKSELLAKNTNLSDQENFNLYSLIAEIYSTMKSLVSAKEYFLKALKIENDFMVTHSNKFNLIIIAMKTISNIGAVNSKKEKEFVEELDKIYHKLFEQEKNYEPSIYFIDYFSQWKKFSVKNYLTFFKK
ncbi:MAG: hypothetical protein ACRCSK_08350 [Fusobacteriaceae bacterium]